MRERGLRWSAFIAGRRAPSADASVLGVLPGEGVGPEVIEASLKVAAAVESVLPGAFKIQTGPRRSSRSSDGGPAGLAPEVFEFCERIFSGGGAILSGPFGGRFVYELRRAFDLFCKLCPVRPLVELRSAGRVKPEYLQDVDLLLVRENVSGLYHGRWYEDRAPDGKRRAHHRFSYTEEEVRRVIEPAARIARSRRGRLALVVKDGGLPTVSALWRECATEVASEARVELSVLNVDYAAYSIVQHAQALDVVVAPNLFGDILGDVAGILLGSRALVYSGNFGSGACAVYQTGHGAARDLAGTDRANPVGQIFSLAMLLRESFGLFDAADLVECAVCAVWRAGWRTQDLAEPGCRVAGTQELGSLVAEEVSRLSRERGLA